MPTSKRNEPDLKSAEHLLGYFEQQVLASYRNEPHKYEIESDYFDGTLTVTNEYYSELEATERTNESMNVRFGYRTLQDGSLAIVTWLPDLFEKSRAHVERWAAFRLRNPEWARDDERFSFWVRRYLEGSGDIDNGPLFYLGERIKTVNGLASELVGIPLYKHEIDQTLGFPSGENTHRYQDAHKALYGYLIDGLDKDCIVALGAKLGKTLHVNSKKTVEGLTDLFPGLKTSPSFMVAMTLVSEQRRLASHGVRPNAKHFPAFSKFTEDLSLCVKAVEELLAMIEKESGVNGKKAQQRHEARKWLPRITRPPQGHYSILEALRMKGKTIDRVEVGHREEIKDVHASEAMIIYFTDGSIMSLDTGSNVFDIANEKNGLRPEEFNVDFMVHWVPELP